MSNTLCLILSLLVLCVVVGVPLFLGLWWISYCYGSVPPLWCKLSEYQTGTLVVPRAIRDPSSPICDAERYSHSEDILLREGDYIKIRGIGGDLDVVSFAARYWVVGGREDVAARKHPEEAKKLIADFERRHAKN